MMAHVRVGAELDRPRTAKRGRVLMGLAIIAIIATAACGHAGGRVVELSIDYRQLPNGGLGAVGTHGLHICQRESDVRWIHVTVDSVPSVDPMPREFLWTCNQLSED